MCSRSHLPDFFSLFIPSLFLRWGGQGGGCFALSFLSYRVIFVRVESKAKIEVFYTLAHRLRSLLPYRYFLGSFFLHSTYSSPFLISMRLCPCAGQGQGGRATLTRIICSFFPVFGSRLCTRVGNGKLELLLSLATRSRCFVVSPYLLSFVFPSSPGPRSFPSFSTS